MALVDVEEVKVVGPNPAPFGDGYQFEITFECIEELEDDLEWKIVYVGSASDESKDQTLEEVMVGPVPLGTSKFSLESPGADWEGIPAQDRLGVTVLNVCCSYKGQPFVNVGYYVNNEYYEDKGPDEGGVAAVELPSVVDASRVYRNVMTDEPRVTRYNIKWHLKEGEALPEPPPTPRDLAVRPLPPSDQLAADDDGDDLEEDDDDEEEPEEELEEEDDDDDQGREIDLEDDDDDVVEDDGDVEEDGDDLEEDDVQGEGEPPPTKRQRTEEDLEDDDVVEEDDVEEDQEFDEDDDDDEPGDEANAS